LRLGGKKEGRRRSRTCPKIPRQESFSLPWTFVLPFPRPKGLDGVCGVFFYHDVSFPSYLPKSNNYRIVAIARKCDPWSLHRDPINGYVAAARKDGPMKTIFLSDRSVSSAVETCQSRSCTQKGCAMETGGHIANESWSRYGKANSTLGLLTQTRIQVRIRLN
jgi:hypothetical protein